MNSVQLNLLLPLHWLGQLAPRRRAVCQNRPIRADELDDLVWSEVRRLLEDPALIRAEIERRLDALRAQHPAAPIHAVP